MTGSQLARLRHAIDPHCAVLVQPQVWAAWLDHRDLELAADLSGAAVIPTDASITAPLTQREARKWRMSGVVVEVGRRMIAAFQQLGAAPRAARLPPVSTSSPRRRRSSVQAG
jgi:hypothetical protein